MNKTNLLHGLNEPWQEILYFSPNLSSFIHLLMTNGQTKGFPVYHTHKGTLFERVIDYSIRVLKIFEQTLFHSTAISHMHKA